MNAEQQDRLSDRENVNRLVYALYVACALAVLVDLLDVTGMLYHKETHFELEAWFGFFGFFGFLACMIVVLAAKLLRGMASRREDYYDAS